MNGEEFVGVMDRKGSSANIMQLVQPADLPNAAFERLLIIQGRKTHSRRNPQAEHWFGMLRSVDYLRLGIVLIDQLTLAQAIEVAQTPESRHDVIAMKGKDGRDLFNVRRRSKRMNVAYAPQTEAIVDPAVGYRVVALISRFADGTVSRYSEYSFREYEPRVFVPTRCRDRVFVQDKPGPDLDTETIVANGIGDVPNELFIDKTITFENVELDYATTPERFSWKSFGLEGKQILLRSRDDSVGMYLVHNGELVTRKSVLGY
jgi:hypothetical protein